MVRFVGDDDDANYYCDDDGYGDGTCKDMKLRKGFLGDDCGDDGGGGGCGLDYYIMMTNVWQLVACLLRLV